MNLPMLKIMLHITFRIAFKTPMIMFTNLIKNAFII
jgi:hypothetical protein